MTRWIIYPLTLTGEIVDLISLERHHFPVLELLAKDKRIWEHYVYDGGNSIRLRETLEMGVIEQQNGSQAPLVIVEKSSNKIIGSTRLMDIHQNHKKLEIGTTWIHPDYWGTVINLECKLLLLTFCFEKLGALRVQLKTDENNIRSRKAIEKIGGNFEGILRNDMLRDNNTNRNSAYYSIISREWPVKKEKLMALYADKLRSDSTRNQL